MTALTSQGRGTIWRALVSILILAGSGALVWALGGAETQQAAPPVRAVPAVEVAEVQSHPDGIPIEVDGVVVPFREIGLASEVQGRIVFKAAHCRIGRTVAEGDILIRIDPQDYQFEVRRLTEEVHQADANLDELIADVAGTTNAIALAKEELVVRQRELKRFVAEEDPGVFSETETDAARRAELASRTSLQSLEDQIGQFDARKKRLQSAKQLSQSQLERAQLDLARTEIRAPLDGVIVADSVEMDGFVQRGSSLIVIQDTGSYDVRASLDVRKGAWLWEALQAEPRAEENDAHRLPQLPVQVVYPVAATSYIWDGVLSRYDGAGINDRTRMLPLLAHVDHPRQVRSESATDVTRAAPPTLLAGMFVKVRFSVRPQAELLKIPKRAVLPGNTVWAVDQRDTLHRFSIQVAASSGEDTLIYKSPGALQSGHRVVVSALVTPVEGERVNILTQP